MTGRQEPNAWAPGLRFSAFGLDVEDLVGISGAREGGSPTGRPVLVRPVVAKPRALPQTLPVSTRLREDGGVELAIGADGAGNLWFDAPRAGRFWLRRDGELIEATSADGPGALAMRNRMLLGQVLPFAALLHGLEVLRASAVVLPAEAVAIHGPAGAGKTAIALALARSGGHVLADDTLAVEFRDGGVFGYPGAGTAEVRREEAHRLGEDGLAVAGRVIGEDRWSVRLQLAAPDRAPARLGALYLLRARAGRGDVAVTRLIAPDPLVIAAATLNPRRRSAERRLEHLELCTRAALSMRICEVHVPERADAGETAAAIEADVEAATAGRELVAEVAPADLR